MSHRNCRSVSPAASAVWRGVSEAPSRAGKLVLVSLRQYQPCRVPRLVATACTSRRSGRSTCGAAAAEHRTTGKAARASRSPVMRGVASASRPSACRAGRVRWRASVIVPSRNPVHLDRVVCEHEIEVLSEPGGVYCGEVHPQILHSPILEFFEHSSVRLVGRLER